MHPFITNNQKS